MEKKILPLIRDGDGVEKEMVHSDLTLGYDGYVFPGPLRLAEVRTASRERSDRETDNFQMAYSSRTQNILSPHVLLWIPSLYCWRSTALLQFQKHTHILLHTVWSSSYLPTHSFFGQVGLWCFL